MSKMVPSPTGNAAASCSLSCSPCCRQTAVLFRLWRVLHRPQMNASVVSPKQTKGYVLEPRYMQFCSMQQANLYLNFLLQPESCGIAWRPVPLKAAHRLQPLSCYLLTSILGTHPETTNPGSTLVWLRRASLHVYTIITFCGWQSTYTVTGYVCSCLAINRQVPHRYCRRPSFSLSL